ncbi:Na/Pi symporter [Bacillus sp. T33-2]|uniref:Na/Pi symporter n=1 Tax=Bacillus sp. T33-2 TaxID=2054168 RepID=UPI000C78F989|nr:Na/Pi symporter [Bacillus sp. T33-2]PLR93815.1 Na/Pi cotransporter [Bacillus sp. T33-2]
MGLLCLFILCIALFIGGMAVMRNGLFKLSAESLKRWLASMTDTPLKGLLAGAVITALLHSSAAVMVLTIGLISARLLTFPRSIGIILGTNIGTTFTLEMITINIDIFIVPFAILGAVLLFSPKAAYRNSGAISLGMAAVFAAMRGFTFIAEPVTSLPQVGSSLQMMAGSHFWSVIAGAAITAAIQSSTAVTGIVMGFLSEDILKLDSGLAVMLGANIGTCITALLASIGAGREAKLTAFAHVWLNIAGVSAFYPFIDQYAQITSLTSSHPDVQLAHASVLFNAITSLVVLPFAQRFGKMIEFLHGR